MVFLKRVGARGVMTEIIPSLLMIMTMMMMMIYHAASMNPRGVV